jgi:aconitate hydratase
VIAESFEHAQRANLVGMGILPLQFNEGDRFESLNLTGKEVFSIEGLRDDMAPRCSVTMRATKQDGRETVFQVLSRLDTQAEVD